MEYLKLLIYPRVISINLITIKDFSKKVKTTVSENDKSLTLTQPTKTRGVLTI